MEKVELIFSRCIQDSQVYGSTIEHTVARVFFSIEGKEYQCIVNQPHGESFSFEIDPIEVEAPKELKNLLNYGQFRDEVEKYYRMNIGAQGSGIRIEGSTNIKMSGNVSKRIYKTKIDKPGFSGAW